MSRKKRIKWEARASGALVKTAVLEATTADLQALVEIFNLAHWPVGITVDVTDLTNEPEPLIVGEKQ